MRMSPADDFGPRATVAIPADIPICPVGETMTASSGESCAASSGVLVGDIGCMQVLARTVRHEERLMRNKLFTLVFCALTWTVKVVVVIVLVSCSTFTLLSVACCFDEGLAKL